MLRPLVTAFPRRIVVVLGVLLLLPGLMGNGCVSGGEKPGGDARPPLASDPPTAFAGSSSSTVVPRFAIFCGRIDSADHFVEAQRLRNQLIEQTPLKDWHLVQDAVSSTLYYGYYSTIDEAEDPVEAARAREDKRRIDSLSRGGARLFPRAAFVPLDTPDPESPPEWNIVNVDARKSDDDPTKAVWTIEIGVYNDHPQRRQYAVDAVRAAREMGVPAYYYHGPRNSSVLIGAWPLHAIEERTVRQFNRDPNAVLLIAPGPLPPEMRPEVDMEGNRLEIFEPETTILDPTMRRTLEQFSVFHVNGEPDTLVIRGRRVPKPSVIRMIPRERANVTPTVSPQNPVESAPTQGGGGLWRIGG